MKKLRETIDGLINETESELKYLQRKKEILNILDIFNNPHEITGADGLTYYETDLKISPEGMTEFINLFHDNEYLEGYNTGGMRRDGMFGEATFKEFYLYLDDGKILNLCLNECDFAKSGEKIKYNSLECAVYSGENLRIKIEDDSEKIKIIDGENVVFHSNSHTDYSEFDGMKLSEVLAPVNMKEAYNRFVIKIQNEGKSLSLRKW